MDYKSVLKSARENLNGSCKVCKVCNGIACSGEVPGMGGKGTGVAFTENIKSLEKVKINMRVLHNVKNPDTSVEMFGKKMKAPIFAAPVSGTTLNMGGKYTEKEYISWVIEGCLKAGIYPMVGDTAIETFLTDNLEVLKEKNADGIAFIKPWENDAIISKMKLAEDAGVFALGVDVDACGLVTLSLHGKNVEPKTLDKIKELKQKGYKIYLISASPEFYLKEFYAIKEVDMIIGTRFHFNDGKFARKMLGANCKGEEKVKRLMSVLKEKNIRVDFKNSLMFSDSLSDTPLLDLVGNGYLINYKKNHEKYKILKWK